MRGAAMASVPVNSPEYVNTVRPAVRLGCGAFQRPSVELSSAIERQHGMFARLGVEEVLHLLDLLTQTLGAAHFEPYLTNDQLFCYCRLGCRDLRLHGIEVETCAFLHR